MCRFGSSVFLLIGCFLSTLNGSRSAAIENSVPVYNDKAEKSNLDEASESFNRPQNYLPISKEFFPHASTTTLTGYVVWGGNQHSLDKFSTTVQPARSTVSGDFSTDERSTTTETETEPESTTETTTETETETETTGITENPTVAVSDVPSPTSSETYTYPRSESDTTSPPIVKLNVDNLGDFHNFSTDGPLAPMSVFHTEQPNLLMGNRVVSFGVDGSVIRTTTIDTGNSDGKVTAVDSHSLPTKEATFLAIAQEFSSGPGNVVSIYLVATENSYALFSRVQTNSSISAMKMYSDNDGNIFLAMAQRSFHCTANFNSECGLSLIYKICGTGEAEISDAIKTGNATTVKLADDTKSISLMYTTCETDNNGTQTCRIINHLERPGMAPLSSIQEFSCDPSNAEFFNMYGQSYYLGPSPTCDKHQISLWDNQMDFMNTFNTFEKMPDSWFIINAGYEYCDASLVIAGVGKDGTTYYSLKTPGEAYTELLHDPQMSVAQMWSAGGNIYCVNKSAESLTLFKMYCPKSYIGQTVEPDVDQSETTQQYETESTTSGLVDETSAQSISVVETTTMEITTNSVLLTSTVSTEEPMIISVATSTSSVVEVDQSDNTTASLSNIKSEEVGPFKFNLRNVERSSAATLYATYLTQPFNLQSEFSSIILTKNGSILVIPPSPQLPCYRSALLGLTNSEISLSNIQSFCNPAVKSFDIATLYQSKAASQYVSGNIYTASLYKNSLEFATVIRENALFEIKNISASSVFTGLEVRICEGFPTVCAVVETTRRQRTTAEVRCYRMIKFHWTELLNVKIELDSRLHLETYSRSERCMMVIESPGNETGTQDLFIYRMKSTVRDLQAVPLGKIQSCSENPLQLLNVQRNLWLATSVRNENGSSCTSGLFQINENNGTLISRLPLDDQHFPPLSMAATRNAQACGGDLLMLQNEKSSSETVDVFVVSKGKQEVTPLSIRTIPSSLENMEIQLNLIANRNFVLMKNSTVALVSELICLK